tara:strand:- start:62 stop:553 length:492 start_codon:yes stop_codon:yes gene_type:complete
MAITKETIQDPCYYYGSNQYASQAEVDSAVLDMKNKLDNSPTNWCVVKRLTLVNGGQQYQVPNEVLSDLEIMSLDPTGIYKVSSVIFGKNYDDLTADEASAAVALERTRWANAYAVHLIDTGTLVRFENQNPEDRQFGLVHDFFIRSIEPVAPTNADMSVYVS